MAHVELIYSGYGCASDVEHRGKWDSGVHQIHKSEIFEKSIPRHKVPMFLTCNIYKRIISIITSFQLCQCKSHITLNTEEYSQL